MLLAGDIGGTKTLLGLLEMTPGRPAPVATREFATLEFDSLGDIVAAFLESARLPAAEIEAACFGVAGPVREQSAVLTNVPWAVHTVEIAGRFAFKRLHLLNDLEAIAHAIPVLQADELAMLQTGTPAPDGNAAVIAAGTGLGEAFLHRVGGRLIPMPSEGGHADFSPRTPREFDLARALIERQGRVSWEHVLSGPGLVKISEFVHPAPCPAVQPDAAAAALPALISSAALDAQCPRCVEALDLFVALYGSEAGNLALRGLATSGVFVGGGIARKILPALQTGPFMEAFRTKPPMEDLLAAVPVSVILTAEAALIGAGMYASYLVREGAI